MKKRKKLNMVRARRAKRARARIMGTAERPRLAVHRTNRYIYAQLIDDMKGITIASASSLEGGKKSPKKSGDKPASKSSAAALAGERIGKKAVEKGIAAAVFYRRSDKFPGRLQSLADDAKNPGPTL